MLKNGDTTLYSWIAARGDDGTQLTGDFVTSAVSDTKGTVNPGVTITWNSQGSDIFNQVAKRLYSRSANSMQRCLGIFLDKTMLSNPQVMMDNFKNEPMMLSGSFTMKQSNFLANLLSSGCLPVHLKVPPILITLTPSSSQQ